MPGYANFRRFNLEKIRMPTRQLPPRANIKHLKSQARDLRTSARSNNASATQRVREFHPGVGADDALPDPFLLSDAQITIAREYGFKSWPRLASAVGDGVGEDLQLPHHERITDEAFRRAVDMIDDGLVDALDAHIQSNPDLSFRRIEFDGGNYFGRPSLLEFIAENPTRNERLPDNIVDVAQVIIKHGVDEAAITDALALVVSGRIVREMGHQENLIALLCGHGAETDEVMLGALAHGEFAACDALLANGAEASLTVAAATGDRANAVARLPEATAMERHLALALAAQHGHAEVVSMLIDAGEDPNRYNPPNCHAHTTPLHQAALAGHEEVILALLAGGADRTLVDLHLNASPSQWAAHGSRPDLAALLT